METIAAEVILRFDPLRDELPLKRARSISSPRTICLTERGSTIMFMIMDVFYHKGLFIKGNLLAFGPDERNIITVASEHSKSGEDPAFRTNLDSYSIGDYIRVQEEAGMWRIVAIYTI